MRPDILGLLEDIREAAQFIADDTARQANAPIGRAQLRDHWEAVNRLRRREPSIAVRLSSLNRIVAFRNAISHAYDDINYRIVWEAVQVRLPILRGEVEQLLRDAGDESEGESPP